MRITVEIDESALRQIQEATGERKMSPAVQKALDAFLYGLRRQAFLDRVSRGETDYAMTNDELEAMLEDDSD
jgi:Arc/MetJ family transcription regulator